MYLQSRRPGLTYVISGSNTGIFAGLKVIMFFELFRLKDQRMRITIVAALGGRAFLSQWQRKVLGRAGTRRLIADS
mgnify:FL=1|jgi:hypothetical protein